MSDTEPKKPKREAAFNDARFTELKAKADAKTLTPSERLEYRKLSLLRRELNLSKQKASLRDRERKADTNRKIKVGGLALAAGLGDWDEAVLRGAFTAIARTTDPQILAGWRNFGGAQYNAEIQARKATTVALTVTFAAPPAEAVCIALRAKGLNWIKDRQRWEGAANVTEVREIVANGGGRVEELA